MRTLFAVAFLTATAAMAQNQGISLSDLKGLGPIQDIHMKPKLEASMGRDMNDPRDRQPGFDVKSYQISIEADPATGLIRGSSVITFKSLSPALKTVVLDANQMQIEAVHDGNGKALSFSYQSPLLTIDLAQALKQFQSTTLSVSYKANRPQSFHLTSPDLINPAPSRLAYTYTEPEGSQEWFPCLDRPNDKATLDITVRVPAPFQVLSNGRMMDARQEGETWRFHYRMDQPIATYLVSLYIGDHLERYQIGRYKGRPLTLWTPRHQAKQAIAETRNTQQMMTLFSDFTGVDYPFPVYQQSVADGWRTSMEHQSATTMGGWRIMGDLGGEGVVAHELAHQWFGDLVTCRSWGELWLNEGFASYLPYVYFERSYKGIEATSQVDYWRSYFEGAKSRVHPLSEAEPDYSDLFDDHAYQKGALVIHMMRNFANQLGAVPPYASKKEEAFTSALRLYLNNRRFANAASYDLEAALTAVTGQSWQDFFDQWVRSAGHPRLRVSYQQNDSGLTVDVTQSQHLDPKLKWRTFAFPLSLELILSDGSIERRVVSVYKDQESFLLPLNKQVVAMNANPDWTVPAEVSLSQGTPAWLLVLKHSPSAYSRMDAVRALLALNPEQVMPEEAQAQILTETHAYVKADAMEQWSKNPLNYDVVKAIYSSFGNDQRTPSVYTVQALARTEAWLFTHSREPNSQQSMAALQQRYLDPANIYNESRAQLLLMMASLDRAEAQRFAVARLKETQWTTKDRYHLVDLLSKQPTEASSEFLATATQGVSELYLSLLLKNLVAASYRDATLLPTLSQGVTSHRQDQLRLSYLDLLLLQTEPELCSTLKHLQELGRAEPAPVWQELSQRLTRVILSRCS